MPDREKVIAGLEFTKAMITFNPSTGEDIEPENLNEADKTTYDACVGAIALLKEQEKQKFFVDENGKITPLPVVVRCKDCKHGDWTKNMWNEDMIFCYNGDTGIEDGYLHEPDWFCSEGEKAVSE